MNAWNNRGAILKNLGKNQEALESFGKAVILNPKDSFFLQNKGYTLMKLIRNKEALECFNKALELNPDNEEVKKYKKEILSVEL